MHYIYQIRTLLQLLVIVIVICLIFGLIETISNLNRWEHIEILTNKNFLLRDLDGSNQILPNQPIVYSPFHCYFLKNDVLPEITDKKLPTEKSIFFFDVSCESFKHGRIVMEPYQACAIESAALKNADYNVYVLYLSPGKINDFGTLSDTLLKIISEYANVQILHLDFQKLLDSLSVTHLYYNSFQINKEAVGATFKFLVLKKYGGIYLDDDVIVLKPFATLAPNFVGKYIQEIIGDSVIGWQGLREMTNEQLNLRLLKSKLSDMVCETNFSTCDNFTILNNDIFYPVTRLNWRILYDENEDSDSLNKTLTDFSYIVKTYNYGIRTMSYQSKTLYNTLAKLHCPKVFSILNNTLDVYTVDNNVVPLK